MPLFVGEANADAKAFSSLHVENFTISDAGGQLDFNTDFDAIVGGNTGTNSATLTGFAGAVDSDGPDLGDVDPLLACAGTGCGGIGQNVFTQQAFPPANSFARSDSNVVGAGILNVPGASASTVTANTVAETQIKETATSGVGNTAVGTDTVFSFSLAAARQLTFAFSARGVIELILGADSAVGSITGANFGFSITIRNAAGVDVFQWAPDGTLNANILGGTENTDGADITQSASLLTPGTTSIDSGLGAFSATTNLLSATELYTLTISHNSVARATLVRAVPEPSSLALLSLGLLAVGAIAMPRRRKDGTAA